MTADLEPDPTPPGPDAERSPEARRRVRLLGGAAVVTLLLDAVSKTVAVARLEGRAPLDLVPGVLDLQLTRNSGSAFSFGGGSGSGATLLLTAVALAVVVAIIRTASRLASTGWALVFGLMLGGALGNLADRLLRDPGVGRGAVVDWVHLHHWPVFNLADTAIVAGGALAVLLSLRGVHVTEEAAA